MKKIAFENTIMYFVVTESVDILTGREWYISEHRRFCRWVCQRHHQWTLGYSPPGHTDPETARPETY